MKKLLTLLVALVALAPAFAQSRSEREEAKGVILGEPRGTTNYPYPDDRTVYGGTSRYPQRYPQTYPNTSRERRIYEVNREYDAKIYSIRMNRTLSRREKDRIIRQFELERRRKIADINNDYYRNNRYDNNGKKSKKYKRDNGNHYGWDRGRGNPHKGRY